MQRYIICLYYYRPKRSFGQGNIFTSICLSRGVGVSQHALQVSPGGLQFFGGSPIFRGAAKGGPPNFFGGGEFIFNFCFLWGYTPPPGTRHRNTVNVQLVRILLECILVIYCFIWNAPNSGQGYTRWHISKQEQNLCQIWGKTFYACCCHRSR